MEATLISRLERAVEKLEKLSSTASFASSAPGPAAQAPSNAAPAGGTGSAAGLTEWDHLISEHLTPVSALAQHLPSEVHQSTQHFVKAFEAARRVMEIAAIARKPEPAELQSLLAPVAGPMGAVAAAAEARRSACVQQLKVLAESAGALSFLAYTGPGCGMSPPRQHVAESWQAAEFFANKLLMEFRGKDENMVAWVRGMKSFMQQLEQYVTRSCPTGLRFDPAGRPLAEAMRAAPGGGDVSKLFAELSKGEAITSGLKKVTDDMKSKNRADRSGAVPGAAPTAGAPAAGGRAAAGPGARGKGPSGPPKGPELQGTKWVVENHAGRQDLVIDNPHPKNSVYVYGCTDCVLQVRGKANAISLDSCSRTGVVFGDAISTAEAVNCSSVQLQVTGSVPTLSVEKTDGAQLYVSRKCAADPNFQVVTAKCSAVNVVVVAGPGEEAAGDADADPEEHPVPEQFISTFRAGKLVTVAAAHSGA